MWMRVRVIFTRGVIHICLSIYQLRIKNKNSKQISLKVFTKFNNIIANVTENKNEILKTNPMHKTINKFIFKLYIYKHINIYFCNFKYKCGRCGYGGASPTPALRPCGGLILTPIPVPMFICYPSYPPLMGWVPAGTCTRG